MSGSLNEEGIVRLEHDITGHTISRFCQGWLVREKHVLSLTTNLTEGRATTHGVRSEYFALYLGQFALLRRM